MKGEVPNVGFHQDGVGLIRVGDLLVEIRQGGVGLVEKA